MFSKKADGCRANQGDWTELRYRKNSIYSTGANIIVTSYYVSKLPYNVSKNKTRSSFQVFGKVVDIYINGKRDGSGSTFVFFKFEGVRDTKLLEKEMCRVRCEHCILKVYNKVRETG